MIINYWRRFVEAAKECNRIEDELSDAKESNERLASALEAKSDRLNRIITAFENQRSGTARRAVKLAKGEAL